MNSTINTKLGKREERMLMYVTTILSLARPSIRLTFRTGKHVVANLYCAGCNALLGWMYISAPNGHEKYKEGIYSLMIQADPREVYSRRSQGNQRKQLVVPAVDML
jgi:hypothetical protein